MIIKMHFETFHSMHNGSVEEGIHFGLNYPLIESNRIPWNLFEML